MKAEELMLRDWVQCERGIGKVIHIGILYIVILVDGKEVLKKADEVQPIPLTPEILEKNGFTYSASESNGLCRTYIYGANSNHVLAEVTLYDLPINGCSCLIRIETDSQTCGGINKIHNCDLLYVHQLQHALRLCGIEKEIVV